MAKIAHLGPKSLKITPKLGHINLLEFKKPYKTQVTFVSRLQNEFLALYLTQKYFIWAQKNWKGFQNRPKWNFWRKNPWKDKLFPYRSKLSSECEVDLGEGLNLQIDFFFKDFGDQIIKTIFFWRILDFKASKWFFSRRFLN